MTSLQIVWSIALTGVWSLYLTLGGAELGATMLLWMTRRDPAQRRSVLRAIGPTWQANDVWLIIAIAAMFGAFPGWYAGWSEALYLPLVVVIIALIIRHAGIEFAGHMGPRASALWARAVVVASVLTALIWGVIWAAAVDGSIGRGGMAVFSLHTLLAGAALVALCCVSGAALLTRHAEGEIPRACDRKLRWLGPSAALLSAAAVLTVAPSAAPGVDREPLAIAALTCACGALAVVVVGSVRGWAGAVQLAAAVTVVALLAAIVATVAPYGYAGGEHLERAAAGNYTLWLMTILTVIFVPLLLGAVWFATRRLGAKPDAERRGLFEQLR